MNSDRFLILGVIIFFVILSYNIFSSEKNQALNDYFETQVNMSVEEYALQNELNILLVMDENENWSYAENSNDLNNAVDIKSGKLVEYYVPPKVEVTIEKTNSYVEAYTLDEIESLKNNKTKYFYEYYLNLIGLTLLAASSIDFVIMIFFIFFVYIKNAIKKEPL